MNRSYRIIPCYSGDVSGAAAALYELGGMMVIHDPSGCNSTYNTHDELRWYDQDSLIFISGLTQTDAILGNDEKFIEDIEEAARELQPRFIAMTSCPIPYMNGTDFPAIARILEQDLGIPAFFVMTNGMHDYVAGAGNALAAYAKHVLFPRYKDADQSEQSKQLMQRTRLTVGKERPIRVNILGATPLDFAHGDSMDSLREWLRQQGFEPCACWALDTEPEEVERTFEADVNLVVSSVGYPLAKELEKTCGMPMVIGVPLGSHGEILAEAIRNCMEEPTRCEEEENIVPAKGKTKDSRAEESFGASADLRKVTLIGEPVLMESAAACLRRAYPTLRVRVLCMVEADSELLAEGDRFVDGEEELEQLLAEEDLVIADPLHEPLLKKTTQLFRLPHLAFSGRCFRREFVDVIKADPIDWAQAIV